MRTIKFRAWIPEEKRMVDCSEMPVGSFKDSLWPVMQFIGLTDKNGKEIYEGDIVRWGDNGIVCSVIWDNKLSSFVVDGASLGGWIKSKNIIEVIGNIYESKHLLDNIDTKVLI